ncbi:MFS transporter [Aestuariivirga sp. YIM B02566]|uniref:MFS transporter n=1 Tax=Taklimakanibacter albus TaxID=2800327 RepID=A0ACC5R1J9_9HYPH|nr:MFS transporter [Aestuariivirga sp. YIM B02566]MBK1866273.1 MFS transporter [Aestuariivirga sp. YIM B02566]
MSTAEITAQFDDLRARRNAIVLAIGQALYGSATVIMFTTAGLIGVQIAPSKAWATLPISAFVIGTAVSTIPAAMLMRAIGRRPGFMLGAFAGTIGALIGVYAIYTRDFQLFILATVLQGVYQAFAQHSRFAAADMASPAFRPKAISWVMTGGVAAGLLGTSLVMFTTDLLAPVTFAGCYAAMAVICTLAIGVLAFVDIPRKEETVSAGDTRPLAEIVKQPRLIVAVIAATLSYGMMNLVMTAAPIAMIDCGFTTTTAAWAIQWHVMAMFVPSFFTGQIIARVGAERVCAAGLLLLAAAATAGLLGISFGHFAVNLILLGLGWNFGFIGGTTLLTECYRPAERERVQGLNDFAVFGTVAIASLTSGKLLDWFGWASVNIAVYPTVVVALSLILWIMLKRRRRAVAN